MNPFPPSLIYMHSYQRGFTGDREQRQSLVVHIESPPNYQYMAVCVCLLTETGGPGGGG
jgi:hypothetical protein